MKRALALGVADAGADGGDEGADFLVGEHLVEPGLLGVDELAAQGQDRLVAAVAALLGGAAGGVALDDVELAERRVALGAVGELAGRPPPERAPLRTVSRALRAASRARAAFRVLSMIRLATAVLDSRKNLSFSPTIFCTMPSTSELESLVLVWPSKRGSETLTETTATRPSRTSSPVIAGSFSLMRLLAFAKLLMTRVSAVLKPGEVRAALQVVDRVRVGEDLVVVAVVVLDRHVDDGRGLGRVARSGPSR